MMSPVLAINRHDWNGLLFNVGLAVGAATVVYAAVFLLGWDTVPGRELQSRFEPPLWAVAAIWVALFALMATARWKLNEYTIIGVVPARRMITVLAMVCLLWPFYALTTSNAVGGFIGDVVAIVIAAVTMGFVWPRSREAALLLVPVILWLSFTALLVFAELGHLPTQ